MASSQQAAFGANSSSGDLMKSSSSALNLSELYNMPMMNLQPNYFHSGPAQSQQQQQQLHYQQQQVAFGAPAVRVAPQAPVIRVAPPPPVQPVKPTPNAEPSFDSLFSLGGFETSGPGWDNPPAAPHAPPAPHAPAASGNGFGDLKVFEKNSAIVEAIVQSDGLAFSPIVDATKTSKFHENVPEKESIIPQKDVKDGDNNIPHPAGSTPADANGLPSRRGFFKWGPLGGGATPVKKQDEQDSAHSDGHQTTANKEHHTDNEYSRFLGEGQVFKAKLIGFLEVPEARGDTMCQDALSELKMRIRVSGDHKQKIQLQVTVDGLKIKDEKSGDCVYHHPVQKISYIVQDLTDFRAFGYVFGTADKGHRFFGIKTEKAASQVVLAMKDLFQIVFELKKKQIEEVSAANHTENPEKTEEPIGSFPDGFDVNYPSEETSVEASRPQLMSQFSLESPVVDVMPLQQQQPQQQQQQQQQKDTSLSALSELMGLQIQAPPSQNDLFSSGMFQQQNFQPGFGNSPNPNISGINFGTNPFGGSQQQQQHAPAFAHQHATFFGHQAPSGYEQQLQLQQQHSMAFSPPASSALNPFGIPSSYSVGNPFQPIATTAPNASSSGTKYGVFDNLSAPAPVSSSENMGFPKSSDDLFTSNLLQPLNSNPPKSLPSKESKPVNAFMDLDPIGNSKPFVDKKDFFSNMRQQTTSPMLALTPMKPKTESAPAPPPPSTSQQGVESLLDWTFA